MELPTNFGEELTPERMKEIQAMMEELKSFLQDTQAGIMQEKLQYISNGGTTPALESLYRERQRELTKGLMGLQTELTEFFQSVEETKIALEHQRYERAKLIHQALREASKTDPSLEEAVRELDALYEDALREEEEEDAAE